MKDLTEELEANLEIWPAEKLLDRYTELSRGQNLGSGSYVEMKHQAVERLRREILRRMKDGVQGTGDGVMTDKDRIDQAITLAIRYGGIDGEHHKAWVIDQMVRVLAGDQYDTIVIRAKAGKNGPNTFEWNCGIAP